MRLPPRNPCSLRIFALTLPLLGCFGTSTGNPTQEPTGEGNAGAGYCKEASSRPVQLNEQTALGFSAAEVLTFVEGTHQETLTWHPHSLASYGPESGEHQLTLTVTRRSTPIRLTQFTVDTGGTEIGIDGNCSDALAIDVRVALQTDGGALDESFDTTLFVRSSRKVSLFHRLDHEQLGGSFEITEIRQPRSRLAQLDLSATLTPFGTSGGLNGVIEQSSADGTAIGAGPGQGPFASWGPASCGHWGGDPVPLDQPVAEFSGSDVISLLDAVQSVNVAWSGAPASSASFTFAPSGGVCAQLEADPFAPGIGGVGALNIAGVLSVRSQDGRIDAAWPVQANALPDEDGALREVKLTFDDPRLPREGSLETRYGLSGIDTSAYDSASVSLTLTLAPGAALAGELRVTGFTNPMCSTEPLRDANGNIVGSPGCQGATPTELARAQLSAAP